jgi:hypothetical protein
LQKFGILWRLYESKGLQSARLLRRPIISVLDGLLSHDSKIMISSETWVRLYLKSIDRIILPIFDILSHEDVSLMVLERRLHSRNFIELYHTRKFNQAQVDYAISLLIALLNFSPSQFIGDLSNAKEALQIPTLIWLGEVKQESMIQCITWFALT